MTSDHIMRMFGKAIELDEEGQAKLLKALPAADREQLENLLRADQRGQEGGLIECLQDAPQVAPEPSSLTNKRIRDYQLLEIIGEGGMGTVYRAHHSRLRCDVALKVLPLHKVSKPDTIARFDREMAAVGQLRHPNIVQAMDAGEERGLHYLVLEFIDGTNVAAISKTAGCLRVNDACEIVRQTALGLDHAHNRGLIHRDIKPSNLLVSKDGKVSVADMGLAMLQHAGDSNLTTAGQIMGTLDYIAPEQIENAHDVDSRADLYSLGCTLYQLLTGRPPFADDKFETTFNKLRAHESAAPTPIAKLRSDVPAVVAAIVHRLIEKSPDDRFQSAKELADKLAPFSNGSRLNALVQSADPGDAAVHATECMAPGSTSEAAIEPTVQLQDVSLELRTSVSRETPAGWRKLAAVVAGCIAVVALAVFIQQRIVAETPSGQIIVETSGKEIPVTIVGDTVSFDDPLDNKQVTVSVDREHNLLKFQKAGFEAITRKVDLESESGQRVVVSFNPKTNSDAASAKPDKASSPATKDAEATTLLAALDFAFQNGMDHVVTSHNGEFQWHYDTRLLADNTFGEVRECWFEQTESTAVAIAKISGHQPIRSLKISGDTLLRDDIVQEIGKLDALKELYVYCKFEPQQLSAIPSSVRSRLKLLGLHGKGKNAPTNTVATESMRQFPNLNRIELHCEKLTSSIIEPIRHLAPTELHLVSPSTEIQLQLSAFQSVRLLKLDDLPTCDLSQLPPNLTEFYNDSIRLTRKNFEDLAECTSLTRVTSRLATIDRKAVAAFRKSRPDCLFESFYEPKTADTTNNKPTPVHAIAAFDNRKGYSYVFLNNGTYLKVLNTTDKLAHSLVTETFWRHLMGERSGLINAALTRDEDTGFVFFSDGDFGKYLNLPDLGIGTASTGTLLSGLGEPGQIAAATDWPDGTYFVFTKAGQCQHYDQHLKLVTTKPAVEFFPNLGAKANRVSAARVDPTTSLAYFYFADGTFQVFDTVKKKVLTEQIVSSTTWKVPSKYAWRKKPKTREIGSTREEALKWAFQHGLKTLECSNDDVSKKFNAASEYNALKLPVTTIVLDCDNPQATRALFCVTRYGSFKRLTFLGEKQISNDVLDLASKRRMNGFEIHTPIDDQQLAQLLDSHQPKSLTLLDSRQTAAEAESRIATLATHSNGLKQLTLEASRLSTSAVQQLGKLKIDELKLIRPSNEVVRQLADVPSVTSLDLSWNEEGPGELQFDKLPPQMKRLTLSGSDIKISSRNFEQLKEYPLVALELSSNHCTALDLERFQAAKPACVVVQN